MSQCVCVCVLEWVCVYFQDYPNIRIDHEKAKYIEVLTPQKHTNFITDYTLFGGTLLHASWKPKNKLWILKKQKQKEEIIYTETG